MYESFPGIRDIFSPKFSACHRQAEFCPKLCLSLSFSCLRPLFRAPTGAESAQTLPVSSVLRLEHPFWEASGNFDPETLPISPVFVPSTLISGTDRRRISPNSACRSGWCRSVWCLSGWCRSVWCRSDGDDPYDVGTGMSGIWRSRRMGNDRNRGSDRI